MYIYNVYELEQKLQENSLPVGTTCDLSHITHHDDWSRIFRDKRFPWKLTFDFGRRPVDDAFLASFLQGLGTAQKTEGLTLCFWSAASLTQKGVQSLLKYITSNLAQTGLTLHLSEQNPDRIQPLLDALTSESCPKGTRIYWDDSLIQEQTMVRTLNTLSAFKQQCKRKWLAAGSNLDLYGTLKNRCDAKYQKHVMQYLTQILRYDDYPSDLTIDFGPTALTTLAISSLFQGLTESKKNPGLTLCFRGSDSLHPESLSSLIQGLQYDGCEPGLRIQLSMPNLTRYFMLQRFVDALHAPSCAQWITIEFFDADNTNTQELIETRKTTHNALWIYVHGEVTQEQRHELSLFNEETTHACDAFLKTPTSHTCSPDTLEWLELKTNESLHDIVQKTQYIDNIDVFASALASNTIANDALLDLSQNAFIESSHTLEQLLQQGKHPFGLTIDFGKNGISNEIMTSLIAGLTSSFGSEGLTLYFSSALNLNAQSFQTLMNALIAPGFKPGLTLRIDYDNLAWIDKESNTQKSDGQQTAFYRWIDTLTSSHDVAWLTVDMSDAKLTTNDLTYIEQALSKRQYAMGFFIDIGQRGTWHQRMSIFKECERAAQSALSYLSSYPTSPSKDVLMNRTRDTLRQLTNAKCQLAQSKIEDHIEELRQKGTRKRISPLQTLSAQLQSGLQENQTLTTLIVDWERTPSAEGKTNSHQISSPGFFRPRTTSTESLIMELKTLDVEERETHSAFSIEPNSVVSSVL